MLAIAPWLFAPLICALVVALTTASVGPAAVLAVGLFLLSGDALGRRLLPESGACATLLGISVYLFLMNLAARAPVNTWWVWGIVLVLPIAADWRGSWRSLASLANWVRSAELRRAASRLPFAALVFALGMHWLIVLKPEKSADGLAMHLAIPANVAAHHAMTFEPARFVWAVMPMGADWAYSIVYLFGGEFAARLLNFAFLLLALALLDRMLRPTLTPPVRLLFLVLFTTTPLVELVTGSLFVENLLAALILGMMAAIWQYAETGEARWYFAAMVLGGTALATKFGALGLLAIAVPFALFEAWRRGGRRALRLAAGIALLAVFALPPYAIAWWKTGNPVFPFLNEKIHSPLIDPAAQFRDNEFRRPLTWRTPYELTFDTHRYYEAQDGAFGFQYLLLAPLALLAADRRSRTAAAVGLGAAVLTLRAEPNARFVYAALPLVMVGAAAAIARLDRVAVSYRDRVPGRLRRAQLLVPARLRLVSQGFLRAGSLPPRRRRALHPAGSARPRGGGIFRAGASAYKCIRSRRYRFGRYHRQRLRESLAPIHGSHGPAARRRPARGRAPFRKLGRPLLHRTAARVRRDARSARPGAVS